MNAKPLAAIFDRDGTLAAIHNGPMDRSNDSWAAYNAALPFDAPVPQVVALLNAMRPGVVRIMVSGRAEGDWPGDRRRRFAMQDWIAKHNLPIDYLFMREGGDQRLDSVVKEEILQRDILPRFDPILAVDDRPQVIDVWRRYGISTLQVVNPGTLPTIGEYPRYWNKPPAACIPECKCDPKHLGCCFR